MAHSGFTYHDRVWNVDTVDIVSHKPIWLRRAVLYPNAIGDSVDFRSFHSQGSVGTAEHVVLDPYASNPPYRSGRTLYAPTDEKYDKTTTTQNDKEVVSTGNFTAGYVPTVPAVLRIIRTSTGLVDTIL